MILTILDWEDASQYVGWADKKGFLKARPALCRTIGILIGSDKRSYKMAASYSLLGGYNDRSSIPRGCVVKKTVLNIPVSKLKRETKKQKG